MYIYKYIYIKHAKYELIKSIDGFSEVLSCFFSVVCINLHNAIQETYSNTQNMLKLTCIMTCQVLPWRCHESM